MGYLAHKKRPSRVSSVPLPSEEASTSKVRGVRERARERVRERERERERERGIERQGQRERGFTWTFA